MGKSLSKTPVTSATSIPATFLPHLWGYLDTMADTEDPTDRNLDAPSPPGSPMRRDQPTADVNPHPEVQPSSTPDGPAVIPSPSTPEGEPGPDPGEEPAAPSTQPSTAPSTQPSTPASTQLENAATSLDQPSDNSGAE
jgi:hypothetical protein